MTEFQLKSAQLRQKAFCYFDLSYPEHWPQLILNQNYTQLDLELQQFTAIGGALREILLEFAHFDHVEHILSLRQGPDDEEGIWHDDGSRPLAFSLGLSLGPQDIRGGELLLRDKKDHSQETQIPALPLGRGIVFLTGVWGKEHRVCAVTQGQRLVCAGWCTSEN